MAAQTGFSVGTVSRVLNNQPHVSELAKENIWKAAEASGFQLNANAKQLKQQQSNSILVLCKGNSNELYDALLFAIRTRLADSEYTVIVDSVDESEHEVRRALQLCREKTPQGILFQGGNLEHFRETFEQIRIPCVLVTTSAEELAFPNLSSVTSDDVEAATMAIRSLMDMGHRDVAIIGGHREESDTTRLRFEGCLRAFRERGIAFRESQYEAARFTFDDGYRAAKALLQRNDRFTALFAMSDVMALGAIRALSDAGKRVPEDISVIGMDDIAVGNYLETPISTIKGNTELCCRKAAEIIMKKIKNRYYSESLVVPSEFVVRDSSGKAKEK